MFKFAWNSDFKQRGAADFPPPGDSNLVLPVNAARQFHVPRASADPQPPYTDLIAGGSSDRELMSKSLPALPPSESVQYHNEVYLT